MLNPHRGIRFLDLKIVVYRIVNIKRATVLFHASKKETLKFFLFLLQPEPRLHVGACVRVGLNA